MIGLFVLPTLPPFRPVPGGVLVATNDGGVDLDQPIDVPGCVARAWICSGARGKHAVQGIGRKRMYATSKDATDLELPE
jgi:hypothetical protein